MGEGFVRSQQGLTKQRAIAENAKRRHLTSSAGIASKQHHVEVDKYSIVPNSHVAATLITKQQIAELLASKHGQITSPHELKTQAKVVGQSQITREQIAQLLGAKQHLDVKSSTPNREAQITKEQVTQLLKSSNLLPTAQARKRDSQLTEEELRYQQSQRFHSNTFEQDTNQILGVKPGADDILKTVGAMQLTGKLSKSNIFSFSKDFNL